MKINEIADQLMKLLGEMQSQEPTNANSQATLKIMEAWLWIKSNELAAESMQRNQ